MTILLERTLRFFACAVVVLSIGAPALAADYKTEFTLYNEALQRGDNQAATEHGKAAWAAAEKELGDNRETAVLAYNYGKLIVFDDPKRAQQPLQRADQLQKAGIADLPTLELAVYSAFDDFALRKDRRSTADALRKALLAAQKTDEEQPPEYGLMWLRLANADFNGERYDRAIASAAEAEKLLGAPRLYRQKATAMVVSGAVRLSLPSRKLSDVEKADVELQRAMALFPPQKDIDTFDPALAQALAWQAVADAALEAGHRSSYKSADDSPCKNEGCKALVNQKTFEECGIEWYQHPAPDYPRELESNEYIGAALLGYNLGDDLAVHNARILAEAPGKGFGDAALATVEHWTLKAPPPDKPECRQFIMPVIFTFR